jgi:hypothetical protein
MHLEQVFDRALNGIGRTANSHWRASLLQCKGTALAHDVNFVILGQFPEHYRFGLLERLLSLQSLAVQTECYHTPTLIKCWVFEEQWPLSMVSIKMVELWLF